MKTTKWIALVLAALMALAGCEKKEQQNTDDTKQADTAAAGQEAREAKQADAADAAATDDQASADAGAANVDPVLLEPSKLNEEAPETFQAKFTTTEGDFVIEFHRDWAPHGVDRAYNLIKSGFYDGVAFFRVMEGFMAQFGIHNAPAVNEAWMEATTEADPMNEQSNTRGMVTFAQRKNPKTGQSDPATRTTHMFINYTNNQALDQQNFIPVGKVVEGMDVVDKLYPGYGGGPPTGPSQKLAMEQGKPYFEQNFPKLDYIEDANIVDKSK